MSATEEIPAVAEEPSAAIEESTEATEEPTKTTEEHTAADDVVEEEDKSKETVLLESIKVEDAPPVLNATEEGTITEDKQSKEEDTVNEEDAITDPKPITEENQPEINPTAAEVATVTKEPVGATNKPDIYTVCGVTAKESALNGNVARVHVKRENLEDLSSRIDTDSAPEGDLDMKREQEAAEADGEGETDTELVKIRKKPGRKRKPPIESSPEEKPKRPRGRPRTSDRPTPPVIERPPKEPSPPIVNGMKRKRKPNRLLMDFIDPEAKNLDEDEEDEEEEESQDNEEEEEEGEQMQFDDDDWTPMKRKYSKRNQQREEDVFSFMPVDAVKIGFNGPPVRKRYGRRDEESTTDDEEAEARLFDESDCRYVLIEDRRRTLPDERLRKLEFDFNKLVRYLKMVKLPAPNWKIRIVVSREQTISEVTFTNKLLKEEERCVKFARLVRNHTIHFGGKVVALVGAPVQIHCEDDITSLLDIVHNLDEHDPVLEYKE